MLETKEVDRKRVNDFKERVRMTTSGSLKGRGGSNGMSLLVWTITLLWFN